MKNVALLASKTANNDSAIMNMPYIRFLCYIHYLQEQEYESYKRQAEMFSFGKPSKTPPKHQTEPDMEAIRKVKGGRI